MIFSPSSFIYTHYDVPFSFWLDWMVAGGSISGNQSVLAFEQILTNATSLDTG